MMLPTILLTGMTGESCVAKIQNSLNLKAGVVSVRVSLEREMADVVFGSVITTEEDVRASIQDLGFTATVVDGMRMYILELDKLCLCLFVCNNSFH